MTKSEKFAKAIKEALATVEQRRALYWKLCHEYAAKSAEEGSNVKKSIGKKHLNI